MKLETGKNASIITFRGKSPKVHESVFACEGVKIIGEVEIGRDCSIWYNAVIRGDVHYVKIGERTNIQDNCMLHVTHFTKPLNVGSDCTIAHSVSLHGCTVLDRCLIGIGATCLDGAVIGPDSFVAAGSVVKENFVVPERTLVAGVPAKVVRELTDEDVDEILQTSIHYLNYVKEYREELAAHMQKMKS